MGRGRSPAGAARRTVLGRWAAAAAALLLASGARAQADGAARPAAAILDGHAFPRTRLREQPLDVHAFRPVEGPASRAYYAVVGGAEGFLLRGSYQPGLASVTMGVDVPEPLRPRAHRLRWRWRARAFPQGGDECQPGRGDSAASVAAAFKSGLRWYVLRFVWSSVAPRGAVCDRKRGVFLQRDTVVLESGGAPDVWVTEEVDLRKAFRDHFADGDPSAPVPDLVGIGVMTDGDQTASDSGADWAQFELLY